MENNEIFNLSLREAAEKRAAEILQLRQVIIWLICITCVFLMLFYYVCNSHDQFFMGLFLVVYFSASVTKFIMMNFVVIPKVRKEMIDKISLKIVEENKTATNEEIIKRSLQTIEMAQKNLKIAREKHKLLISIIE